MLKSYIAFTGTHSDARRIPESLAQLLFVCFAANPADRPESALVVADRLTEIYKDLFQQEFPMSLPDETELPAGALNNRGLSLLEIGKEKEGKQILHSAFEDHPESIELAYNGALLDWRDGRISGSEAFQRVYSVYQNFPKRWLPIYGLGSICAEEWDFKNARYWLTLNKEIASQKETLAALSQVERLSESCNRVLYRIPATQFIGEQGSDLGLHNARIDEACGLGAFLVDWSQVAIWDVASGNIRGEFSLRSTGINAVISPRGDILVASVYYGDHTSLEVYAIATGEMLHELTAINDREEGFPIAFSPRGDLLVCGLEKKVAIWNPYNKRLLSEHEKHSAQVTALAISPNGTSVASVDEQGGLRVWDVERFTCQKQELAAKTPGSSVAFCREGTFLVTNCGVLQVWGLAPLRLKCSVAVNGANLGGTELQVSKNGRFVCCGNAIVTLNNGRVTRNCAYSSQLCCIQGKELLVEQSADGLAVSDITAITNSDSGFKAPFLLAKATTVEDLVQLTKRFKNNYEPVSVDLLLYSVWGDKIDYDFATTHTNRVVTALEMPGYERHERSSKLLSEFSQIAPHRKLWRAWPNRKLMGHTAAVNTVALITDGAVAASGSEDRTIRVWDVSSASCKAVLKGHKHSVRDISISEDSRLLASASHDGTVRLWDISDGKCTQVFAGHEGGVESVRINASGELIISGAYPGNVRVWEVSSGKCVSSITVSRDPFENLIKCVDIDREAATLLCVTDSSARKSVQVRKLVTGELLGELVGHDRTPFYGRLSIDGKRALTLSFDDTLKIWDLETFQCVHTIDQYCWRAVFTFDGDWILGGSQSCLSAFDVATGRRDITIRHPTQSMSGAVCISADGTALAAASDRNILSWQLVWRPQWGK